MWIPWLQYEINSSLAGDGKRQRRRTGSLNHSRRYACRFFCALIRIGYFRFYRVMSPHYTRAHTRNNRSVGRCRALRCKLCSLTVFLPRVLHDAFARPLSVVGSLGLRVAGDSGFLVLRFLLVLL